MLELYLPNQIMDLGHILHNRLRSKIKFHLAVSYHTHDLNIKATDFALHPLVSSHPGEPCCLMTALVSLVSLFPFQLLFPKSGAVGWCDRPG